MRSWCVCWNNVQGGRKVGHCVVCTGLRGTLYAGCRSWLGAHGPVWSAKRSAGTQCEQRARARSATLRLMYSQTSGPALYLLCLCTSAHARTCWTCEGGLNQQMLAESYDDHSENLLQEADVPSVSPKSTGNRSMGAGADADLPAGVQEGEPRPLKRSRRWTPSALYMMHSCAEFPVASHPGRA
jgi:hypothetical protein